MPDGDELPKLNWVPFKHPGNRNYSIAEILPHTTTRYKRIWTPRSTPLDQGREGACVGFSFAGELAATPIRYTVSDSYALDLYHAAQAEDRKMGNHWDEGASILAGAKAGVARGLFTQYRWAFGVEQLIDTIIRKGPVVIGIYWYSGMYSTLSNGLVRVSGQIVGGHAIMVNGYWPKHPTFGDCFIWTNSWGPDYGLNGQAFVKYADMDRLLREDGEACIPTDAKLNIV